MASLAAEARNRLLASRMVVQLGHAFRDAFDAEQNVYKKRQRTVAEERYTARIETWCEAIDMLTGIGPEYIRLYAEKALREVPPRPRGEGFWDEYEMTFWSYAD